MNRSQIQESFFHAWQGIRYVYRHERNFRIQLAAAWLVVVLMWLWELTTAERVVLLLLVMAVLTLELLNSALEKFVDLLKPRLHLQAGVIKDIMAAMVLLVSLGALVVGVIIFWPHLYLILNS